MRVEKEKNTQIIRKLTTQKSAPELSYFTFFQTLFMLQESSVDSGSTLWLIA